MRIFFLHTMEAVAALVREPHFPLLLLIGTTTPHSLYHFKILLLSFYPKFSSFSLNFITIEASLPLFFVATPPHHLGPPPRPPVFHRKAAAVFFQRFVSHVKNAILSLSLSHVFFNDYSASAASLHLTHTNRNPSLSMASSSSSVIKDAKVLMVGAGGIACDLLKTLALSGFTDIHIAATGIKTPSSTDIYSLIDRPWLHCMLRFHGY